MYLLWLRVAAVLYGLAAITVLPAVLYGRPKWRQICLPATVLAVFFHFVSVTEMLNAAHRWTPTGMHQVQSLLGLLIAVIFLIVWCLYGAYSLGIFALPLAFFLVFISALGPEKYAFNSPMVRSGWLFFHIAAILAAYAALIISMLASFLYLAQERRLKRKHPSGLTTWLPPLETMDKVAHLMLLIGFPCMTAGLAVGSLIAQESVGPAYFLDPKVILSFGMWGLYVILLFVRRNSGLRGLRAVYLSSIVFLVMLSVWVANQFSAVHRFTAP